MEFKQIQELLKVVNKSNISEVSIKDGDFEITIKQASDEVKYVTMPQPQMMPAIQAGNYPAAESSAPANQGGTNAEAAKPENDNSIIVKSPMIGTFYRSASPEKPPFVGVGDEIKVGDVICIVEAMKLFNEIESEVSGRIVKVLIDDASPVEYDQPLFLVEPK